MPTLYSIVVPVYNSGKSLPLLAQRVATVFDTLPDSDYELIFVDDASPDPLSWKTLGEVQAQNSKVSCIQLTRNFGQQSATLCGMAEARGDFVVTMDDDLQHRPEDILKLIAEQDFDIVIGTFRKRKHNAFKRFTSHIKGWFDYMLIGKPKHIRLSSFRLINRTVVDGMLAIATPNPFIPALMFYVSKHVTDTEVAHESREDGKGNYTLMKMIKLFSNLIINNSAFLMRVIGIFGMLIALTSFVLGGYFIVNKLFFNIAAKGWTSIIVTLLFIGGLLLLSIGVMGEYLIRIISVVEQKPTYIVRQKLH